MTKLLTHWPDCIYRPRMTACGSVITFTDTLLQKVRDTETCYHQAHLNLTHSLTHSLGESMPQKIAQKIAPKGFADTSDIYQKVLCEHTFDFPVTSQHIAKELSVFFFFNAFFFFFQQHGGQRPYLLCGVCDFEYLAMLRFHR